jgi:hypothetical protein
MDAETRECCISVITDYCAAFGPKMALDLIGWRSNRTNRALADAQAPAVLAALLPTLDGDELNMLMRAIAESVVNDLAKKTERAA